MKKVKCVFFLLAFVLVSCAPGNNVTLPPGMTLAPGTEIPQQVATNVADVFTQTVAPSATDTPYVAESTPPVETEAGSSSSANLTPIPTMPGPFRNYVNTEAGYSMTVPPGWNVDEYGLANLNKEVVFVPGSPEPFITYLNILLDFRTLDQVKNLYAQSVPDAVFEDVVFNGYAGIKYTYNWGRVEYFIPHQGRLLLVMTDRPNDGDVQQMLGSIRLTSSTTTAEVTMADNGTTYHLHAGDRIWLNLDSGYDWSVSVGDPTVIGGAEYLYVYALSSGVSTITALGNPKCANSTPPCLAPSHVFTITVVVQ